MIKQKQVVPGALAALAVGTLVQRACRGRACGEAVRRGRRSEVRTHGFRRIRGWGRS
jgi:hypothetical protein